MSDLKLTLLSPSTGRSVKRHVFHRPVEAQAASPSLQAQDGSALEKEAAKKKRLVKGNEAAELFHWFC